MIPAGRPLLKVCCISSADEATLAIEHGAAAVGLVSNMPSGPGVIPDALIEEISASVPTEISTFLLTSSLEVDSIVRQHQRFQVDTIQLCDALARPDLAKLRTRLPGVTLVQVIHVLDEQSIDEARSAAEWADALLLDSGNPKKRVKELGGTGRTHDWRVSREIREAVAVPVWLAGGLTPVNVGAAIQTVRPHGVDVCSGVRTGNRLDSEKLRSFAQALSDRWT